MPFRRYVEIGRVAIINYGEEYGKLVVISDVVDQNRVSHSTQLLAATAAAVLCQILLLEFADRRNHVAKDTCDLHRWPDGRSVD